MLGLLVYGYTTGVFSSRKLERATYDSVAFCFIAANDQPDHDTIATFQRRFLKDIEALFVRVLELAREMGLLRMGTVGLDGTKIHANASWHSALSYEHAGKIEAQLQAEVSELRKPRIRLMWRMACRSRRNWRAEPASTLAQLRPLVLGKLVSPGLLPDVVCPPREPRLRGKIRENRKRSKRLRQG
jgi:hypothetical protein